MPGQSIAISGRLTNVHSGKRCTTESSGLSVAFVQVKMNLKCLFITTNGAALIGLTPARRFRRFVA